MTGKNNAFAANTNKQSFLGLQTYKKFLSIFSLKNNCRRKFSYNKFAYTWYTRIIFEEEFLLFEYGSKSKLCDLWANKISGANNEAI